MAEKEVQVTITITGKGLRDVRITAFMPPDGVGGLIGHILQKVNFSFVERGALSK